MREAKFTIRKAPGRSKPWFVEVSASHSETGKRQRLYFGTKDAATVKQAELRSSKRQQGEGYRSLPPGVAEDAVRALRLISRWPEATLIDAAKTYAERREQEARSDSVADILDAYHAEKKKAKSPRYVGQIDQVRKRLTGRAGQVPVATLDAASLDELLDEESVWTRNANARILKAAIRFAYTRDRVPTDLSKKIHIEEIGKSETAVLSPDQAAALMGACSELSAPVFAIRLFAGVRAEETVRLPTGDIDLEKGEIYIRDSVSKMRGHDRIIAMEENLKLWLAQFPPGGSLVPTGWEKIWDDVRASAGLKDRWHQNVLRHTYAAYWLAKNGSLDGLASRLGHFGGLHTLRRHYYRAVSKRDAEIFWAIMPQGR